MMFFLILLFPLLSFAQDSLSNDKFQRVQKLVQQAPQVATEVQSVSIGSLILQLFLGLTVVGVLLYLALRLLKKLQQRAGGNTTSGDFQVLQTFYLSPNQKIQKVVIYEKIYLLGVTNESIQVLDTLGDADQLDVPQNAQVFTRSVDDFLKKFKRGNLASFEKKEG